MSHHQKQNPPANNKNNKNGFALIEVIVSIFIIGVVVIIYAVASNSIILNRNAKRQELALRIAQTQLETLRNTAYGSLPASGAFNNALLTDLPNGQANMAITTYNPTTKQAVVTVTWYEPGNEAQRSVSLTTLINEGGL